MSVLTTLGAGSGIDSAQLIKDLTAAQRAGADSLLARRKTTNEAKTSSLAQVSAGLALFASALKGLASSGTLSPQVRSSDSTALTAVALGTARPPAAATVEVEALAAAQTLVSAAAPSSKAPIGTGTLTFSFGTVATSNGAATGFTPGSRPQFTVTVGPESNSLEGLASAINAAAGGISATILNDGTGARLVLKGQTGTVEGFTISASSGLESYAFGIGSGGLSASQTAQNAQLRVDGVLVERPTNSISDAVPGLRLDLTKASPGVPIRLSAAYDSSTITEAISNYVAAYNELATLLNEVSRSSADGPGGPLAGDRAVRELKQSLTRSLAQPLLTGSAPASLADIGVKTNRDGTLGLDNTVLAKAARSHPERIEAMFTPHQASSSPLVRIVSPASSTKPGSYGVADIVAATPGALVGSNTAEPFPEVVVTSANASFTVKLDGRNSLSLSLPTGSYTDPAQLAERFEATINADPVFRSYEQAVDVKWTGTNFTFTSLTPGSASMVQINDLDPDLASQLGLAAPSQLSGTNASGTIDGVAAVGTGNRLSASPRSAAAGLTLEISPGVASATIRIDATIPWLVENLQKRLSSKDGALSALKQRVDKEAADLAKQSAKIEEASSAFQARLTLQFAAMEKAVSAFKSTQSFLEQQIAAWDSKD